MKHQKPFLFLALILSCLHTVSQQLPLARNIRAAYQKGTRSPAGKPGKNYWQNRADYLLRINFNPETRLVAGTVDINYTNNSPDTLKQIWFKLYPNLYKTGTPRESAISPRDLGEGVVIDSMWINGKLAEKSLLGINGTNMTVNRQSVPGSKNIRFRITYHYIMNKTSHVRTGEVEPNAHFAAYFFPRVAVYDDIDGWNRFPYNGRHRNFTTTSATLMPTSPFLKTLLSGQPATCRIATRCSIRHFANASGRQKRAMRSSMLSTRQMTREQSQQTGHLTPGITKLQT